MARLRIQSMVAATGVAILFGSSFFLGDAPVVARATAAVIGIALGLGAWRVAASPGWASKVKGVLLLAFAGGIWLGYLVEPKVKATIVGVIAAVGLSALVFIGANSWFALIRKSWSAFGAVSGGILVGLLFVILVGNGILSMPGNPWLVVVFGMVIGGIFGGFLTAMEAARLRMTFGGLGGAAVGGVMVSFMRPTWYPAMRTVSAIVFPVALAILAVVVAKIRDKRLLPSLISGVAIGLGMAAWLASRAGGTLVEALVGTVVLGAIIGLRLGLKPAATETKRLHMERNARAAIFLGPALLFVFATLVVPTVRTIVLSFLDKRSKQSVGFLNYKKVFSDTSALNFSNWTGIFSSSLFWWAVALGMVGLLSGYLSTRKTGGGFESNGFSIGPLMGAGFLLAFAIFSNLRGTVFNNLWWVFTVTTLATSFGLAIAVLADRAKFQNLAKSIIFLPMAISFVGASIIWRFVYIARPIQKDQTGILNSAWVWLGRTSTSGGRSGLVLFLVLVVAGCGFLMFRGFRANANGVLAGSASVAIFFVYLIYRTLGPGLGGIARTVGERTYTETIIFTQEAPFNNVWLMVVLIWIQTGFTMVIFSAAIRAVPSDLIEAARVDGASETQTFWRLIIPQISPTIGVVTTTLVVLVMKVFDVVKVVTNGNFGTQVMANLMWTRGFAEFDLGLGSTIAVLLFASILPVMIINIRRMQREAQ